MITPEQIDPTMRSLLAVHRAELAERDDEIAGLKVEVAVLEHARADLKRLVETTNKLRAEHRELQERLAEQPPYTADWYGGRRHEVSEFASQIHGQPYQTSSSLPEPVSDPARTVDEPDEPEDCA